VGQAAFAKAAGTWVEGTDETEVKRGLLAKGFVPEEYGTNSPASALQWLRVQAMSGRPVLLCVNAESHWCCTLGVFGKRFVVFDPGRWDYRVNSGVTILPPDALRRRWRAGGASNRRAGMTYYGLAVHDGEAR
jgi:hypothetical protein